MRTLVAVLLLTSILPQLPSAAAECVDAISTCIEPDEPFPAACVWLLGHTYSDQWCVGTDPCIGVYDYWGCAVGASLPGVGACARYRLLPTSPGNPAVVCAQLGDRPSVTAEGCTSVPLIVACADVGSDSCIFLSTPYNDPEWECLRSDPRRTFCLAYGVGPLGPAQHCVDLS